MKKRTISAVVKYFYPVAAGIETNMLETYSVLSRNGWDVTIHTTKDTLTSHNILSENEQIKNLYVKRYVWSKLGFWPNINWDYCDVLTLHNFNVLPHVGLLCYIILRRILHKRTPRVILTPHGGFTPDWTIFPLSIRILKYLLHRSIGVVLLNTVLDGIRAVSTWEANELVKYGVSQKNIHVIPNGLENEAFSNVIKEATKDIKLKIASYGQYIVQIGRVYTIKNYETTIRALAHLPYKIHFVIAGPIGSETYLTYLNNLISKLRLNGRVHFLGVIRGVDKYYLIRKSLCMVHMARWESFCNVVHEGMSQGKVCIVADNTALKLLIQDGIHGFRVPTYNVDCLVRRLKWLLNYRNRKIVSAIGSNNRIEVSKNTWVQTAINFERMLLP